jgi:hypothetical protein
MAEEYVSGEKYREMKAGSQPKSVTVRPKPIIIGLVVLILMGLSFYGGIAYQKGHQPKAVAAGAGGAAGDTARSGGFGGGGRFNGQRPTSGLVTAVSASSITVTDSTSGAATTLAITSSTQISDNGQTVAASDIQVGDTVLIVASTTDKTQAARILVNPSFGGGGGGGQASGNSSDGGTDGSGSVTN